MESAPYSNEEAKAKSERLLMKATVVQPYMKASIISCSVFIYYM